jgi:hypothetical protein
MLIDFIVCGLQVRTFCRGQCSHHMYMYQTGVVGQQVGNRCYMTTVFEVMKHVAMSQIKENPIREGRERQWRDWYIYRAFGKLLCT